MRDRMRSWRSVTHDHDKANVEMIFYGKHRGCRFVGYAVLPSAAKAGVPNIGVVARKTAA